MAQTDTALLAGMRDGNQKAFSALYERYWESLLKFAGKRLIIPQDAEEVVQEVFVDIWNRRAALEIKQSFGAYLHTATRNQIFMRYRKWLREQQSWRIPQMADATYAASALDALEYKDLEKKYWAIIASLPEKCREVFLLSRQEQLTHKEIAERLSISVSTVEKHIGKAIQILRAQLKDELLMGLLIAALY